MPKAKWVEKSAEKTQGFNLGITLSRKPTKGEVGLEIEIEGNNLPHSDDQLPDGWTYHIDHSLRGEENGEYVLAKPIAFSDVPVYVERLWDVFKTMNSEFDDSNRTSVHVHLNCQDFHLNRLTSFLCMWFALEEPLTEWCGDHRVGNLFCLRAVDAPAIINCMKKFIKSDCKYPIGENFHYAAMNPNALHKFGSLEVRTLRGAPDATVIINWVAILEHLYKLSAGFPDPRDAVALFSSGGPLSYFDTLLGDKAELVRSTIGWNNNDLSAAMFRGIRFAQDLCYCRDWDAYSAVNLQADPFGRDSRKLAPKIAAIASDNPVPIMGNEIGSNGPDWEEPDDQPMTIPIQPASISLSTAWQSLANINQFDVEFPNPFTTGDDNG